MNIIQEQQRINQQVNNIVTRIFKDVEAHKICRFHLSELPESNNWQNHPNIDPVFKKHLDVLNHYKRDCLYWFNCDTKEDAEILNQALNAYRSKKGQNGYRVVPTTNKLDGKEKTIYVGVRRGNTAKNPKLTNIMGRINQHLGYYHQPKTQGLQFLHWAKDLEMYLTLYVVHFDDNLDSILYVIEKAVAKHLVPHCGRH